jgi:hypothetical protein
MAKSLLILMLMAAQVLAGTGGSVYLCFGADGAYCCLDAGPESCTCCQDATACHDAAACPEVDAHCSHAACDRTTAAGSVPDQRLPQPSSPAGLSAALCECTHLLLVQSPPVSMRRVEKMSPRECFAGLVSNELLRRDAVLAPSPPSHWRGPPELRDWALTVLATVVIRC